MRQDRKISKWGRAFRYDLPLHFVLLFTNWLPDMVIFLRLRGALAKPFFGRCGKDLRLGRNLTFYNPMQVELGKHVYLAYGCWFMAGDRIMIDDEVMFGPYCVTVSSNHQMSEVGSFRYSESRVAPIKIGSGSWIGAKVTITAGSSIGEGCLIGAGAVVVSDIPDHAKAMGVPARMII